VSTKTGTVVQLLAGGIPAAGVLEDDGRSGQVAPHGVLVGGLGAHVLEGARRRVGRRSCRDVRPRPGPAGGFLVQGDSDILHDTILVLHESCINVGAGPARTTVENASFSLPATQKAIPRGAQQAVTYDNRGGLPGLTSTSSRRSTNVWTLGRMPSNSSSNYRTIASRMGRSLDSQVDSDASPMQGQGTLACARMTTAIGEAAEGLGKTGRAAFVSDQGAG
jgi:hypothetical protein